jgi:hypothetical protein
MRFVIRSGRALRKHRTGAIATKDLERVVVDTTVQEKAIARRIPSTRISRPQLPGPLQGLDLRLGAPRHQNHSPRDQPQSCRRARDRSRQGRAPHGPQLPQGPRRRPHQRGARRSMPHHRPTTTRLGILHRRLFSGALFQSDYGVFDVAIRNLFRRRLGIADRNHISDTIPIVNWRADCITRFLEEDHPPNRFVKFFRQLN